MNKMKHCPTCGAPQDETKSGPTIYRSKASKEGSCNFCNRWIGPHGLIEHDVTVVKTAFNMGIVVRFCDECSSAVRAVKP